MGNRDDRKDFLYPLSATSGYTLTDRGQESITPAGFSASIKRKNSSVWRLASNFNNIERGDRIWAYFTAPYREIRALGHAARDPQPSNGGWELAVVWDTDLTARLEEQPIHFADFQQTVRVAATASNTATTEVLAAFLTSHTSSEKRTLDEHVRHTNRAVRQRLGQKTFRDALLIAYGSTCAISGTEVVETLQAAHINPVAKGGRHAVSNGILLRADLHTLFDYGYITINQRYTVQLHPELRSDPTYSTFHGRTLNRPQNKLDWPSPNALARHAEISRQRLGKV